MTGAFVNRTNTVDGSSPGRMILATFSAGRGPTRGGCGTLCRVVVAAALVASSAARGQPAPAAAALERVVVSGGGVERRAFDAPFAVGVVDADELASAGPLVNLSESLARVPGVMVTARQNYAQDLQMSSRGFGARSTFGVRGLRLYADGIPATMPDGQGQVSHFDLAGAASVEVLRGPFTALYGNSSGGVVSLTSAAPRERRYLLDGDVGSYGLRQARLGIEGPLGGGWDFRAQASRFHIDGMRPHSAAERTLGNLRLGWRGESDALVVVVNAVDQPAEDPLGLTRAQFDADARQTAPQALQFDTRKRAAQQQAGLSWTHRFSGLGALRDAVLVAYAGRRSVTQWQAIPVATQADPRHPGGVIDFDRGYEGADARLGWRWDRARLVAGVNVERQREARRGYENYLTQAGATRLGVTGALRRDERNRATTTDAYAQAEADLTERLTATLGARSGRLVVSTRDAYLANGDDSGDLSYRYTTPVAALRWRAAPGLSLYVSAGRGFESPTLSELAYRPDGSAGFNTALKPQTSRQVELGAKWRHAPWGLAVDAAVFRADTDDEIGVQTNAGGRATYRNVGRTRRDGAELSLRWQPAASWRTQLAVTWLDATYRDGFLTCASAPCAAPALPVAAGNRIAGTMAKSAWGEVAWGPSATSELALEVRAQGSMAVNDVNSDAAPSAVVGALRARHALELEGGQLSLLARLDNLTNRRYAGSVVVNEGNGRYFEPAAGRNWWFGVRWQGRW